MLASFGKEGCQTETEAEVQVRRPWFLRVRYLSLSLRYKYHLKGFDKTVMRGRILLERLQERVIGRETSLQSAVMIWRGQWDLCRGLILE